MTTPSQETTHTLRRWAAARLADAGIDTAMLDTRVLLGYLLDMSPTQLLIADNDPISDADRDRFLELIEQRAIGVPLAYLTGTREFMGLAFRTSAAVLVPRPDTEPLVEWALNWLRNHPHAVVADIGTGSGAIAVSIAHHAPATWTGEVTAIDISAEALAVARGNADDLLAPDRRQRMSFLLGDLTTPLDQPVDLLVTNLPYLTPNQMEENPALRHEPSLALDGGRDGLDLVRRVIADLPRVLSQQGAVGFEIDPSQEVEVTKLLSRQLADHTIATVRDLAGDARHIVAVLIDE